MQKQIIRHLFYKDKWNIGFVYQTVEELVRTRQLGKICWMPEDSADYSADPFVYMLDSTQGVFYERLNLWQGRGTVCHITGFDFQTRQEVTGFTPAKFHLSYPYTFKDGSILYCIPETAEAREVALYEVQAADNIRLKKRRILLTGAPYLDSSLVKFQDRYWLFTSKKGQNKQFFIYHADSLNDDFRAHAMNPIRCEPAQCRSAGHLFAIGETLFRPTQNPLHEYGGSIVLSQITELTPERYSSGIYTELRPDAAYPAGLHTLSITSSMIVVDGKRKVFAPLKPLMWVIQKGKSMQIRLQLFSKSLSL